MDATGFHIRVAGGDADFVCASGDTLLRAAQRAGLGFPYECNVGSCSNCRFELVEGEVAMAWEQAPGWTDKDRQRQRYLGCQAQARSDCVVKLRLDARCVPLHRPQRMAAVLQARRTITHDISEFSFRLERPQLFEPGQYALAYLPGVTGGRAYSMSNTAGDGSVWEFQVRRVPGGRGSMTLFDSVQLSQRIEIDGPYGMAWLRRDAPRDILCLAGGSGLAPMISIARGAMAEPRLAQRRLHFLYGARTPADICGENMLSQLPGFSDRISYHAAVSLPPDAANGAWSGSVGYLHDVALQRLGAQLPHLEIYFAGPPAMTSAVQRMLLQAKVPVEQMHFDQFY